MKPEIRVKVGESEIVFRLIVDEKGAEFRMGSRGYHLDEEPAHMMRLTKPYYLAETPVTQEQFAAWRDTDLYQDWFAENAALIKRTGYFDDADAHENGFKNRSRNPAENVTWWEALAFARWLTPRLEGWYPGLPTEAQWEYACRDGSETEYWNGDGSEALREVGWFSENSKSQTQEVGQKRANGKGLFDLHGNVWEWCYDAFDGGVYRERISACVDSYEVGAVEKAFRVLRGGSWSNSATNCRSAYRYRVRPGNRNWFIGFRLGLFPGPVEQVWPEAAPGAQAGPGGTPQTALERKAAVNLSEASFSLADENNDTTHSIKDHE